jgi:succinyldiaminopimelate transaminase
MSGAARGFVPPPYPYERLAPYKALAEAVPGGLVDCSIGDPCDPVPASVADVLAATVQSGVRYPPSIGTTQLRTAACGWMDRRLGVSIDPSAVIACVGTKELVASLPHHLHLRDPERDTVLHPDVAYPTYEMGALLGGLRSVPVRADAEGRLDLDAVSDDDADRALLLWINHPANPTGAVADVAWMQRAAAWGRSRGIVVASDECYVEFSYLADGTPAPLGDPSRASILHAGSEGVLAVHSLSKRSNMAGMRVGFVAGDPALVGFVGEVRKHAGMMVPGPVQAAAAAALDDDAHVDLQVARYGQRRRIVADWAAEAGLLDGSGRGAFYLWLSDPAGADGWDLARRFAETGMLVSPGDLYGIPGRPWVRVAVVQPDDRLVLGVERLSEQFDLAGRAVPSP